MLAQVAARFAPLGPAGRSRRWSSSSTWSTSAAASTASRWCRTPTGWAAARPRPRCSRPSGWTTRRPFFELVDRYCEAQDLPIKGALCEFAPGQFEINLGHVDDMVLAADQGVMLKRCIKAAARATGQRATFMAKPFAEQSGSGLHVHLSLVDRDGRNLFGETPDGERRLRHAVRGLQDLMAEAMLVFAPNANSYRRLRPLTYAPTAATWGWNNRTVALRIPPGGPAARRDRAPGRGLGRQPLSRPRRGAGRRAARPGAAGGARASRSSATPTRRAAASLPLTWEAAIDAFRARRAAATSGSAPGSAGCSPPAARRERDRFHARITPTEYEWYLTTV